MSTELLDDFSEEVEIEYEGEVYLVRDNGSVLRRSRPGQRMRRLDDNWTFGRPDASTGYMVLSSSVVHRIVALAFHPRPSPQHVVDHIDTNRRNNRADNLRWLTRLENVLLNPVTRRRIEQAYGSIEAFFRDPSAVVRTDPDFGWMRTVSKAEAEESRKKLYAWADSAMPPKGGRLGEWVFREQSTDAAPEPRPQDIQSATPNAVQRRWRTVCEFPACPASAGTDPLGEYVSALQAGAVFASNSYGNTVTEVAGRNESVVAVVGRMPEMAVKGWAVAQVTVEDGTFVHESLGSFFTLEGALNVYNEALGIDAPHVETIDDYT
jgi:hypothetical protein